MCPHYLTTNNQDPYPPRGPLLHTSCTRPFVQEQDPAEPTARAQIVTSQEAERKLLSLANDKAVTATDAETPPSNWRQDLCSSSVIRVTLKRRIPLHFIIWLCFSLFQGGSNMSLGAVHQQCQASMAFGKTGGLHHCRRTGRRSLPTGGTPPARSGLTTLFYFCFHFFALYNTLEFPAQPASPVHYRLYHEKPVGCTDQIDKRRPFVDGKNLAGVFLGI